MKLWLTLFCGPLVLAALMLGGCVPSARSHSDEEKEPHFMSGQSRASTLDYKGAIESFEKALEVNPRSAAAHFELACLFDVKEPDPAAAIYHYESYLKLRPEAGNADVVKQRITTCKQELARNVSLGPLTERQQRDFEQVVEDNKKLSDQLKRVSEELEKWRTYATRQQLPTNQLGSAPAPTRSPAALVVVVPPVSAGAGAHPAASSHMAETTVPSASRTHTVKAGETPTMIARKYGVKVDALLTANPRVDARRLQVGQSLIVPGI